MDSINRVIIRDSFLTIILRQSVTRLEDGNGDGDDDAILEVSIAI